MPVPYPSGPTLTVATLLKQPRMISRALTSIVSKRFVADRIFARGTSDQVQGGAAIYQKSESIYPNQNVEEVAQRAEYPRAAWTEQIFTATVRKYGLEVPISDEAARRNAMDEVARAQRKLANQIVKFVDGKAMTLLTTDADVQTLAASGDWALAATNIILDIATAKKLIADMDEGYEADTLVVSSTEELALILDQDIRDAMPREGGPNAVVSGTAVPILGLRQIIVTNQITAGTALVLEAGMVGTIADEQPESAEGYGVYPSGPGLQPIYVKMYRNDNRDETIVRGARFPAMWIAEPKAAVKITGA
jgi:hypothetical protein